LFKLRDRSQRGQRLPCHRAGAQQGQAVRAGPGELAGRHRGDRAGPHGGDVGRVEHRADGVADRVEGHHQAGRAARRRTQVRLHRQDRRPGQRTRLQVQRRAGNMELAGRGHGLAVARVDQRLRGGLDQRGPVQQRADLGPGQQPYGIRRHKIILSDLNWDIVQHILALSRSAVTIRHWFEINLDDASTEHGARVEIRDLPPQAHRGSESASQLIAVDRPLWRADLFDRTTDAPGTFAVAHYHPRFTDNEPSARSWDPALTADPWAWLGDQITSLGAAAGGPAWPLDPADAAELPGLADAVVTAARRLGPAACRSPAECFRLTRDVQDVVQLMIATLRAPECLDRDRAAPWLSA
jgi:hypothetical protein